MNKTIQIGLIQDKYSNLILYDETIRTSNSNFISLDKINAIQISFKDTSSFLNTNHIFRFDNTELAYVIPYDNFEPFDGSDYNNSKYIKILCNNVEYILISMKIFQMLLKWLII